MTHSRRLTGAAVRRPFAPRFWSKVDRSGDCWVWTASTQGFGYGTFWVADEGRMISAHRVSWQLTNGPIPAGGYVLHRCDNPLCVRPAHLYVGTHADNMADMKARQRTHGFGRWSQVADACLDCGTTERRHISQGRCWKCYQQARRNAA